jgi:hypothetical protein
LPYRMDRPILLLLCVNQPIFLNSKHWDAAD